MPPRPLAWKSQTASTNSTAPPSRRWLAAEPVRATRPLRSTPITGLRRYYETARPCAPRRYSPPRGFRRLGFSLRRPATGQRCATGRPHHRGDRFPRSAPEPEPGSRHLHAGHRLASQQAPARLIPGDAPAPGFDVAYSLSTRHQWFTCVRLPGPHLTRSRRALSATLTTTALDRSSLRWFAASPCRATAEDHPPHGRPLHLRCSTASVDPTFYIKPPSTFVVTQSAETFPCTSITRLALSSSASARSARRRSSAISTSRRSAALRPRGRESAFSAPASRCLRQ